MDHTEEKAIQRTARAPWAPVPGVLGAPWADDGRVWQPGQRGSTGAAPALAIRHLTGDGDEARMECSPMGGPGLAWPWSGTVCDMAGAVVNVGAK